MLSNTASHMEHRKDVTIATRKNRISKLYMDLLEY
jgi:hypothetical protein